MKSRVPFFILIVGVIISRIPLIFGGYGTDGDAWRIAQTSLMLWNEGIYHISRFPGFPLYEFLQTPIIALGGSVASNAACLAVFILSILVFKSILEQWKVPHEDLVLLAFAFLPIFWKNSAVTMDYIWGLLGILATLSCVLNRHIAVAGIILGLAAGIRMTNIIYTVPLLLLFTFENRRQILIFISVALFTTILCYIPALRSEDYNILAQEFFNRTTERSFITLFSQFLYRAVYSLGLIGWGCITLFVFTRRTTIRVALAANQFVVSGAVVAVGLSFFVLLPDEREYLIPAIPFLLLCCAFLFSRLQFGITVIALLSYTFVSIDVIDHKFGKSTLNVTVQEGYVMKEYYGRAEFLERRTKISQALVPDSSIVMIGMGPAFWLENPYVRHDAAMEKEFQQESARSIYGTERYFIYATKKPQLDELRKRGYSVYYWDEMEDFLETFIGYKFADERIAPIKTLQSQITSP
ncbi:MAG: hypothetical protein M0R68_02465 [Bacteroidetes bacterium]|nr:hypothetical protein [Bacteroidota bacterium]